MSGGLLQLFETLFRRRFWIVVLAGISLISLLLALGINGIIAAQIAPFTVAAPVASATDDDETAIDDRDSSAMQISDLLTREQPPAEPLVEEETDEEEEPEEEEDTFAIREGDCQQSSIPAILVGTMVDAGGRWSYGIVQDQQANRTAMIRAGMFLGGAEVLAVERERVWVLNDGFEECLKPNQEPATETTARSDNRRGRSRSRDRDDTGSQEPREGVSRQAEPQAAASDRSGFRSAGDLRSGINRVSPTEYEIDRDAVEAAMENPRMLQSQAPEFTQNFDNGRPNGIRLTRIPAGSIFSAIGIRQGDVIMEVNGNRVTTAQRAMELYDALRTESRVEVIVQRRGRMRTLSYNVQ